MTTYHRERSGKRSSYDDEENEEVMRAAGNNRDNGAKSDGTKTAADKWKGIGNRHMASQEYEEAYQAYSTAISISPLGPSSHIYLSNRAAALLSLKKYSAASVDARRAITLAPTFGKAHARLGQSLYFLKDYAGAIAAYENAFQFEPDNQVTWTYLNKAKKKFTRENEKKRKKNEDELDVLKQREMEKHKLGERGLEERHFQGYKHDYDEDATNDGHSVTDSVNLANMAISVIGDNTAVGDRNVSVMRTHHEGDDIDELVAAVDNGDTSIVRGKLQAALDSSRVQSEPQRIDRGFNYLDNTDDGIDDLDDFDDPDFDEALRFQEVAAIKLLNKEYKSAVEEFSAALFLVPDDANLTPQLYVGRAHALNGLNRHEGAMNDAMMALARSPDLPEAQVALARTFFYLKNFNGAVASFEKAKRNLGERDLGDNLSPLDELYYEKAIENSQYYPSGGDMDEEKSYRSLAMSSNKPIPKLKPPRFVSRQQLLHSTNNVPPMSKAIADQLPSLSMTLRVGTERLVVILSDTMGVTLNRGPDGIVRVLSVAPDVPSARHTRRGQIDIGDIIREVAGVDLRRPLTNVMWSDTIAHMKMTPRPLHILVAKELSSKPSAVEEELLRLSPTSRPDPPRGFDPPSRASGVESVQEALSEIQKNNEHLLDSNCNSDIVGKSDVEIEYMTDKQNEEKESITSVLNAKIEVSKETQPEGDENKEIIESMLYVEHEQVKVGDEELIESVLDVEHEPVDITEPEVQTRERNLSDELNSLNVDQDDSLNADQNCSLYADQDEVKSVPLEDENKKSGDCKETSDDIVSQDKDAITDKLSKGEMLIIPEKFPSERLEILKSSLDKDFIFMPLDNNSVAGDQVKSFTNTKWLAELSSRQLLTCGEVYLFEKGMYFWQQDKLVRRTMALYSDIIVFGREPTNATEVRHCWNEPDQPDIFAGTSDEDLLRTFLVAEVVIDLKTSKLRRSFLTTPSSIECIGIEDATKQFDADMIQTCFEILTPAQKILISCINEDQASDKIVRGNRALFLTTQWEESIKDALCSIHGELYSPDEEGSKSWIHQIILGSLHSHIIAGNYDVLEKALIGKGTKLSPYPGIDEVDEDGLTALHYACFRRSDSAVAVLLNAGANCCKTTVKGRKSPCHISAEQLDAKSLSMILSQSQPCRPDPNAIDENGNTPMTVAVLQGREAGGNRNALGLKMCVASLQAWGGCLHVPYSPHPIHVLSASWCHEELEIVLDICEYEFPITGNDIDGYGQSINAFYDYPLHACLNQLREKIIQGSNMVSTNQVAITRTLELLLSRGFEPNERVESVNDGIRNFKDIIGYTPLQLTVVAALNLFDKLKHNKHNNTLTVATTCISSCTEMLVFNGGRLAIDEPIETRFSDDSKIKTKRDSDGKTSFSNVERSVINVEKHPEVMSLMDAKQNLHIYRTKWQRTKTVVGGSGQTSFLKGKGLSMKVDDTNVAGGSSEKNCAICWKKFGQIRNRKHICRSSRRYVCEACSQNTVLVDGDSRRVSDGQFNLAIYLRDKREEDDGIAYAKNKIQRKSRIENAWQASRGQANNLQQVQKDETAAKDELFGSVGRAMKNFFMEEVEVPVDQSAQTNDKVSGVMASLSQTGEAFRERGEKLNTLVEKTSALKNASEDFAKMAKELNESQQKGFFW